MTRAERAAEAARLRAEGLLYREIGERMGISTGYAQELVDDPDGSARRARRDSYRRPCLDCGKLLNGSDGRGPRAPQRCVPCASAASGAERKVWTREAIIDAIRSFADEFGEPPAVPDWCPTHSREIHDEARALRAESRDDWPHFMTVVREFGSWSAGMRAAGFTPRLPHGGGGNVLRRRSTGVAA